VGFLGAFVGLGGALISRFRASSNGIGASIFFVGFFCMLIPEKRPKLLVYCDESCTGNRYLGLGITLYNQAHRDGVIKRLQPHFEQFKSEVKWSKVTNRAEHKYRSLVDGFFRLNKTKTLHYHCLFADSHKFKHAQFEATDEDTFYKLHYSLLTHRVSQYGAKYDIHVFMDERDTPYSLTNLRRILNHGAQKEFGLERPPYRTVEPLNSKKSKILQIQDVILGGMTTRKNEMTSERQSKKNLSQYIFEKCGVPSYDKDTPSRTVFSIWNFRLK
jgi:hypothetical protein